MRVKLLISVRSSEGFLMAGRVFDSKEEEIPQEVMEALSEQVSTTRKVVEILRLDEGEVLPSVGEATKAGVKAPAPKKKAPKPASDEA